MLMNENVVLACATSKCWCECVCVCVCVWHVRRPDDGVMSEPLWPVRCTMLFDSRCRIKPLELQIGGSAGFGLTNVVAARCAGAQLWAGALPTSRYLNGRASELGWPGITPRDRG